MSDANQNADPFVTWLLRMLPHGFRLRFGDELAEFCREEHIRYRDLGGVLWQTRFRIRIAADVAGAAIRLRFANRSPSRPLVRRFAGSVAADAVSAARSLRRTPGFNMAAAAVLALGIGATTASFSILDSVLLRPLPYPDSDRLVLVATIFQHDPDGLSPVSPAAFVRFRADTHASERMAAVGNRTSVLLGAGEPETIALGAMSEGYLDMLGGRAVAGRLPGPADHLASASRVVVLGYGFWQERYGGDRAVIGTVLRLDGEPYQVIGVLNESFHSPPRLPGSTAAMWTPLGLAGSTPSEGAFSLRAIALLRPGATPSELRAETDEILTSIYGEDDFFLGTAVAPLRGWVLGDVARPILLVHAGVVLLLLIGAVNIANLLLARATERGHELVIRSALGANRLRIIRQLLAESILLALAGGAAGVVLAAASVRLFRATAPAGIPRLDEVAVDVRVLAFAVAVAITTGLLFGLAPALQGGRVDPAAGLADRGRGGTDSRKWRQAREGLVIGEVSLAVLLALAGGLMVNSYIRLNNVDPGFRATGLMDVQVQLGTAYDRDTWNPFYRQLVERARTLPGVRSAGLTTQMPFTSDGTIGQYTPQDLDPAFGDGAFIRIIFASEDLVETLGMSVISGRSFRPTDGAGESVVLVNEAFVREYWPRAPSPIGMRIKSGVRWEGEGEDPGCAPTCEVRVVGVVSDTRSHLGEAAAPEIYFHFEHEPWSAMNLVVRTDGPPTALASALRSLVAELDPELPVGRLATVSQLASDSIVRPRFYTSLIATFGLLALLLTLVGVYGTTACTTGQKTREIGIRMALGATSSSVVGSILLRTLITGGFGVMAGLVAGVGATRFMAGFLYGIDPLDPATFLAVAILVTGTALLAAWLPARRAAIVDPASTLRNERGSR